MQIQRQSEGGKWSNEDRVEMFIAKAIELNPQAIELLEAGKDVRWDKNYWYAKIRMARPVVEKPAKMQEWVQCDCGDVVLSHLVMNASRGTSCPDCYDAMSN